MKVIYENKVTGLGENVNQFRDMGFFIMFGENAPAELTDFCYHVTVEPLNGEMKPGQIFKIDDEEYKITAVGTEAPVTLAGLGHMTVSFSGATEVDMPGSICLESKPMPDVKVGTVFQIIEA